MAKLTVLVRWRRAGAAFTDGKYSRAHEWAFDGGAVVPASSSPHIVPAPFSDLAAVDPEEAFTAAISSCHMLWFLDFAARAGYVVDSYCDNAEAQMGRRGNHEVWVERVTLVPDVRFSGTSVPDEAAVRMLHDSAHESCFIAHSVRTEVIVRGAWSAVPTPAG